MSLLPVLLSELDSLRRPANLFDQYFGDVLLRDDLLSPSLSSVAAPLLSTHYLRPWRAQHHRQSGVSHLVDDKDAVRINLDVKQFKPEELAVKVVDGYVVVEGSHEERQDEHGYISRSFSRRYKLPDSVDPDTVASSLSSDGVLVVTAPKKALPPAANTRSVPITQTQQPAAIQHKEGRALKQDDEKMEK
ncbi:protein lethal(2)essential for life-like [Frankliniella occidentalis]|uniref:Protein lethal(2)essential for life-like n=1 Tax=Frankliniella occidentalis TaxID=133901 RepID=A0A6J1RUW8_FRAOC|nr:protein lethal(2)essential for life-like [Frankliniella occidentalis]